MESQAKVGWWNTGFRPPTTIRNAKGKRSLLEAVNIIFRLIDQKNISILGLCEISDEFLTSSEFSNELTKRELKHVQYTKTQGNLVWDIALIYDPVIVEIGNHYILGEGDVKVHKKIAVKWEAKMFGHRIDFYLSHFTAKSIGPDEKRELINDINSALINSVDCKISIAMGDYNLQLFEENTFKKIARSRQYAQKKLLSYSPFWKKAGEKFHHTSNKQISGTSFYDGTWHFVDFMFYHPSLCNHQNPMYIDDSDADIIDDIFLPHEIESDHLPIYLTLRKNQ